MENKFVETVLYVVGLGVIILLIVFAAPKILNAHEKYDCAGQVKISGVFSEGTKGHFATDIDCPSETFVVGNEDDEEVKAFIAEEMKGCWDNWGQGNSMLFDQNGIFCHICDYITFKEKSGEVQGFNQYLWETEAPGSTMNYMTYFMPGRKGERYESYQPPADMSADQKLGPPIDKSKGHAVIFYYLRGDKEIDFFMAQISENSLLRTKGAAEGAGVGIVAGGLVGAAALGGTVCVLVTGGTCALLIGGVAAVGGLTGGAMGAFIEENPPNYASFLLFRELTEEELTQLGCKYAPVG
jgi:hypothetical protein